MKKEGFIEFKPFKEKVKTMKEETKKKYRILQKEVKELMDDSHQKEIRGKKN